MNDEKLKLFQEMFKLVAMHELTYLLESNSGQLQSTCLTAEQATASIDKHCIGLQELRSTEELIGASIYHSRDITCV